MPESLNIILIPTLMVGAFLLIDWIMTKILSPWTLLRSTINSYQSRDIGQIIEEKTIHGFWIRYMWFLFRGAVFFPITVTLTTHGVVVAVKKWNYYGRKPIFIPWEIIEVDAESNGVGSSGNINIKGRKWNLLLLGSTEFLKRIAEIKRNNWG